MRVGIPCLNLRPLTYLLLALVALTSTARVQANTENCEVLFVAPATNHVRAIESIKSLRLMTYNLQEFSSTTGKPEWKITAIAKIISEINADIVALQEVANIEMLKKLDAAGLAGQYHLFLIPGNDQRLEIAFLVKKDLPFELRYTTNKDVTHERRGRNHKIFTRDLPQLSLLYNGKAYLNVYGVHTKSKRQNANSYKGRHLDIEDYQLLQMKYATKLVRESLSNLNLEFASARAVVLGDFNANVTEGNITRSLELGAGFRDVFDLTGYFIRPDQRITHVTHSRDAPITSQLDAILVSARLRESVQRAQVYRYKHPISGLDLPIPRTPQRREELPSDHYPLWTDIAFDFEEIANLGQ